MDNEDKTPIYLTGEEIELFKKFREFQDDFEMLCVTGFFDFKGGTYVANRDQNGIFQTGQVITNFNRKFFRRSIVKDSFPQG